VASSTQLNLAFHDSREAFGGLEYAENAFADTDACGPNLPKLPQYCLN